MPNARNIIRNKGSKRLTLHKKHKIERKIREHKRKVKREGEPKKGKKDPGIPNLWPFKEELLQQIERARLKKGEEAEEAKRARDKLREQKRKQTIEEVVRSRKRAEEDEKEVDEFASSKLKGDGSRRAFLGELRKVVEASDVLLEVLDARDPIGSRCTGVERFVTGKYPSKKIILVLNKIDLVPREAVEQWLKCLRNEHPTVAFKCSTQQQRMHLAQSGKGAAHEAAEHMLQSSECLGAEPLLQLLKNYARSADMKTSVTVGVVGLPNVGKSSLINSLKRTRVVNVGATPGVTRAMQEVHLDKHVKLLDCPGVVLGGAASTDPLRNAVKVELVADPVAPVETLLKRCQREQLMMLYHIPAYSTAQEFLFHVARMKGKLRKGGVPDVEAAARIVLQDWNTGRISYYTMPPAAAAGVHVSATILSSFSDDSQLLARLSASAPAGALLVAPSSAADDDIAAMMEAPPVDEDMDDAEEGDEDEEMESDEEEDEEGAEEEDFSAPPPPRLVAKPKVVAAPRVGKLLQGEDVVNPQTNRRKKEAAKLAKKKGRRAPKADADEESEVSDVSKDDSSE